MALWGGFRPYPGSRTAPKCDSFHDTVHKWRIMAQLGTPDMRLPIQHALYRGARRYLDGERLDFAALGSITFENPDMETFKGLPLAIRGRKKGRFHAYGV